MREQGRLLEAKGVALLVVLTLLVWLSIAVYQKKFVSTVDIEVHTERAGLQLNTNADVRMRGALVGRVTGIDVEDGEAVIRIALDEDQLRVHLLSTTRAGLAAQWEDRRKLTPDTEHPGLATLIERRQGGQTHA